MGTTLTDLGLGSEPLAELGTMVAGRVLTVDVRTHPYDRPAITTASRHLVTGTAEDDAGRINDFAFFVKVVQSWGRSPLALMVPEPLRSQTVPLVPWRTEPDIYRGELRQHLPPGLSLPPVHRITDLDDTSAAIWLDRVPVYDTVWDVEQHRRAAYLLGRLAAAESVTPFAMDVPVFRTARRFAEHWLSSRTIPALAEPREGFDDGLRRRIAQVAAGLPALLDELEALPVLTSHGDACTANLLPTADGGLVLIDFGFWGRAPGGFDLAQLLLGDIQLGHRPADVFLELEDKCLPAYVQGLRAERCAVTIEQVRRAHAIVMTVFHAIPAIPEERDASSALLHNRAAMARHILDLLDASTVKR